MLYNLSNLLLDLFNMSITACFIALAVIVIRLIFKKIPKVVNCILWGLVALRLICPFSVESIFSLIPSRKTLPDNIITGPSFEISSGINAIDSTVNNYLSNHYYEGVTVPSENGANVMEMLSIVWLIGVFAMLIYAVISVIRVKKQITINRPLSGYKNVYLTDNIDTAFILGFIKPKIYVPSNISEEDIEFVLAHEKAHIKRKDHLIKPFGFLILSVYWFNPILWISYILFCKDIESACDEKVLKTLGTEVKKEYSKALIKLSTYQKRITACPIAFGETGVKSRVKSILNYKKPAFWIVIVAVVVAVVASACFLTNPETSRTFPIKSESISDIDPVQIVSQIKRIQNLSSDTEIYMSFETGQMYITDNFDFELPTNIEFYYTKNNKKYHSTLQVLSNENKDYYVTKSVRIDNVDYSVTMQDYLEALKYLPKEKMKALAPEAEYYHISLIDNSSPNGGDNVITYSSDGDTETKGSILHLQVIPMKRLEEGGQSSYGKYIDLYYKYNRIHTPYCTVSPARTVVKSTDLEEAIHLALLSDNPIDDRYYNTECMTEGHIVFGKEEIDSELNVFLFQDIKGYGFSSGNLVTDYGSSSPAVIVFQIVNNEYVLKEIRYPFDGEPNRDSVKSMMPTKYWLKALNRPSKRNNISMNKQCVSQAKEYLKSIGRTADVFDYSEVLHIFPSDVFELTTEQENNLDTTISKYAKFNYAKGNYEKVIDGKRYVFETEYDLVRGRILLTEYEYDSKIVAEYHEIDVKTAKPIENISVPKHFVAREKAPVEPTNREHKMVDVSD